MGINQDVINIHGQIKSIMDALLCVFCPICVEILFIMLKHFTTYHVTYVWVSCYLCPGGGWLTSEVPYSEIYSPEVLV